MVANRPASAYSVRAMTSSTGRVRGSARISASRAMDRWAYRQMLTMTARTTIFTSASPAWIAASRHGTFSQITEPE